MSKLSPPVLVVTIELEASPRISVAAMHAGETCRLAAWLRATGPEAITEAVRGALEELERHCEQFGPGDLIPIRRAA